ncbi:MAG: phosphate starvation-inducible protein PhoH [Candidatus Cloacimonadota bacterium]|nr:MAG: phosphate starvation-inducible protein PhoH [Candidatus Cloacimonadota bacterium]
MKKTFVLDTNVLLHNADSIFSFEDNDVVIPIQVIEELDRFKKESNDLGRNARQVARHLDKLRETSCLTKGVKTKTGGKVRVVVDFINNLPPHFDMKVVDNQILAVAKFLQNEESKNTIFVSKDLNARIKADALGLKVEDYETNKVNFDEMYKGYKTLEINENELKNFDETGVISSQEDFVQNEFSILICGNEKRYARYNSESENLEGLKYHDRYPWGIGALNDQQHLAIDALLDDKIQLVCLVGKAGTGKTLLALAAGLQKSVDDLAYKRIAVSRPIMPMGKDIGYLPGTKDEKLANWMMPIFDNLHYIFDNYITEGLPSDHLDLLLKNEKIRLEALTYIRGRSITNQWLIIDESQNLTPHEIKTIISRAGEGTKIVLTGDPNQIDNPYLDPSSNGLTYLMERFKGQPLFCGIVLANSERSTLASLAADIL